MARTALALKAASGTVRVPPQISLVAETSRPGSAIGSRQSTDRRPEMNQHQTQYVTTFPGDCERIHHEWHRSDGDRRRVDPAPSHLSGLVRECDAHAQRDRKGRAYERVQRFGACILPIQNGAGRYLIARNPRRRYVRNLCRPASDAASGRRPFQDHRGSTCIARCWT